ncbi:MAG: HEAT repeat domain-containing protein, partial [Gemmatimonadaceae bacterium]
MYRYAIGVFAALLMTSSGAPGSCDSELPARHLSGMPNAVQGADDKLITKGALEMITKRAEGARVQIDIRGLLQQAHGAPPLLCGLAAEALGNGRWGGWGSHWGDAPSPPIGAAASVRARAFPRGDEMVPSEVRFLLDSIGSPDACVREFATRLLGSFGGPAVAEQLATLLGASASSPVVREAAAMALGLAHEKLAVPSLLRVLRDELTGVRANAAWALGRLDDGRAVAPIRALVGDEAVEVREAAVAALGQLDSTSSSTVLQRALREDKAPTVRQNAAWALGKLEPRDAIATLASALHSDARDDVREMSAWALGSIESKDALAGLIGALRDSSYRVRETAAWALGSIEDASAIAALGDAAGGDARAEVRGTAAWALGQIERAPAPRGLVKALSDPVADVRLKAAWAISEIGDSTALPAVRDAFRRETDSRAKRAQVRAMARGGRASVEALGAMLHDMDPELRKAAVRGLAG